MLRALGWPSICARIHLFPAALRTWLAGRVFTAAGVRFRIGNPKVYAHAIGLGWHLYIAIVMLFPRHFRKRGAPGNIGIYSSAAMITPVLLAYADFARATASGAIRVLETLLPRQLSRAELRERDVPLGSEPAYPGSAGERFRSMGASSNAEHNRRVDAPCEASP